MSKPFPTAYFLAPSILIAAGAAIFASLGTAAGLQSPFTNAVVHSEFHAAKRDPFSPVGYVKPTETNGAKVEAKPVVHFKLKVTGISIFGSDASATLDNGQAVELGGTYPYLSDDGKTTVPFKVIRITEDSITVTCDGKEHLLKLSNDNLDLYNEKEEP